MDKLIGKISIAQKKDYKMALIELWKKHTKNNFIYLSLVVICIIGQIVSLSINSSGKGVLWINVFVILSLLKYIIEGIVRSIICYKSIKNDKTEFIYVDFYKSHLEMGATSNNFKKISYELFSHIKYEANKKHFKFNLNYGYFYIEESDCSDDLKSFLLSLEK